MDTDLEPHLHQIRRAGKILWGFALCWLIFNLLASIIVILTIIFLGVAGSAGESKMITETFAGNEHFQSIDAEVLEKILAIDFANFLEHFWLTQFYSIFATGYFALTMVLILKIASAWKRGDVFGPTPIRLFRTLGWIYLVHGIIGQAWGMAAQFIGDSNTSDLIYFSFIRDVSLMSFSTSGTGIEWGLLCLALSWILKHAKALRDEQQLVV